MYANNTTPIAYDIINNPVASSGKLTFSKILGVLLDIQEKFSGFCPEDLPDIPVDIRGEHGTVLSFESIGHVELEFDVFYEEYGSPSLAAVIAAVQQEDPDTPAFVGVSGSQRVAPATVGLDGSVQPAKYRRCDGDYRIESIRFEFGDYGSPSGDIPTPRVVVFL